VSDVRPTTDASLAVLFSQLTTDVSGLVRDEMELAKVELKEDIRDVGRAGGMLGGAALAGYMAIVLVSFAAAWGLAELMPVGVAFLIVGALWGIAGYLLYLRGRDEFQKTDLKPQQTITTLKEDVQWAKNQRP
jgi:uncharacterized membrane protein YqjE